MLKGASASMDIKGLEGYDVPVLLDGYFAVHEHVYNISSVQLHTSKRIGLTGKLNKCISQIKKCQRN